MTPSSSRNRRAPSRSSAAPSVNRKCRSRLPRPAATAVLAEERDAPVGQPPIRWLLATTLLVELAADVERGADTP